MKAKALVFSLLAVAAWQVGSSAQSAPLESVSSSKLQVVATRGSLADIAQPAQYQEGGGGYYGGREGGGGYYGRGREGGGGGYGRGREGRKMYSQQNAPASLASQQ